MVRALIVIASLLVNTALFATVNVAKATDDGSGQWWPFPDES